MQGRYWRVILLLMKTYTISDFAYDMDRCFLVTGKKAPLNKLVMRFLRRLLKVLMLLSFVLWYIIFTDFRNSLPYVVTYNTFGFIAIIGMRRYGDYRYAELRVSDGGKLNYSVHGYIYGDFSWESEYISDFKVDKFGTATLNGYFTDGTDSKKILNCTDKALIILKKAVSEGEKHGRRENCKAL